MRLPVLFMLSGALLAQAPAGCDRACLEGFINQYVDALAAHNPFEMPLARKVKFSENDVLRGCAEQINTKIFGSYQRIYPRRFPVVDVERQLVFGFFMYQQPGDVLWVESPGHGTYNFPDSATTPGFTESAQLFRIKAGKIGKIDFLTLGIPYGMPNPFFKDDWRRP